MRWNQIKKLGAIYNFHILKHLDSPILRKYNLVLPALKETEELSSDNNNNNTNATKHCE